eukprot:scaffold21570_cov19-Tisochrysis_lutea.AAC.1
MYNVFSSSLKVKPSKSPEGLEFVWSNDSNEYAIRESPTKVKLYKNFQEKTTLKLDFNAEGIFGGSLVGVKSGEYIVFYDWEVRAASYLWMRVKSAMYIAFYNWEVGAAASNWMHG